MTRQLSDWLEYYLQFTQGSEPPTQYHLWSGISAIASCLQRKCWTDWGLRGYTYPNLYTVLVGPPAGRKGTAMKIAKNFVQNLDVPLGPDSLGSSQALYQEIIEASGSFQDPNGEEQEHKSLSVWSEEFQVFLGDGNNKLVTDITDLFDAPDKWKYRTLARSTEDLSNCWLNLIGAITPTLLQSALNQAAVGGGLLSRIIFVVGYGRKHKVPLPFLSAEEIEIKENLQDDLEQIRTLTGAFRPTERFLDDYSSWYLSPSAEAGVDSDKFVGYNGRRALHIQKLCMIMSASENDNMVLTSKHFKKALAVLEYTEFDMPNAFYGLGRGMHSDILSDLMRYMQEKAVFQSHISWVEIVRRFQLDALPPDLEIYLNICEQTGMIKKTKSASNQLVFEVLQENNDKKDNEYLNKTLFRRMDR